MKRPTVYILQCRTGRFYVGVTSNLDRRIAEHDNGEIEGFTKLHGPCKLVWHEKFQTMDQAIQMEKRIKGWRRDKKIALIEGRYEVLPELSVAYFRRAQQP